MAFAYFHGLASLFFLAVWVRYRIAHPEWRCNPALAFSVMYAVAFALFSALSTT